MKAFSGSSREIVNRLISLIAMRLTLVWVQQFVNP